ncbi:ATP-binding cassette domain-containing protein [Streptomyces sp. NPDC091280]|uniref:ATP-binding cassette domain-containing protein n=1 Tax=Streptomyces sp. NPDC091280 TaxID=3365984 RepID=UPI0037F8BDA4
MSETTGAAQPRNDVPAPRSAPLPLPPSSAESIAQNEDGEGMVEAWWLVHQGASARTSVWKILAELPRTVRQIGAFAWRANRTATIALAVLQAASAVMSAFGLVATVGVAQHIFADGPTPDRVRAAAPQLLLVVGLLSARGLLEYGVTAAQGRLTPLIRAALEGEFYRLTSHVKLEAVDSPTWQDECYRARNQGLHYARQVIGQVVTLASALMMLVGTASVLAFLHPVLLLLLPLSVLPVGVASVKSAKARFHSFRRFNEMSRRTDVFSWLMLDRDAAAELRSHTAQQALLDEHGRLTEEITAEDIRLNLDEARLSLLGRGAGGLGMAVTYVVLGLMLIHGWLPLAAGAGAVLALQSARSSMTRVVDVAHLLYETSLWVGDLLEHQERCRRVLPRRTGTAAPNTVRSITLDGVHYTYPGKDKPALAGITMTVNAGETIAFVGPNGSGKSTCSKLLAGLYDPTDGAICWDGTPTTHFDTESLQARVASVLQDPTRYPFSALSNITVSRGTLTRADPERVLEAAVASGADQVIAGLTGTWAATLSKRFRGGQELSAGMWAKIAVARGEYKDAPVLLLDEPTASMDPRAEHAVYQTVLHGTRHPDRITVLISHRLASVIGCDRIYVFDNGTIIEAGTHEELLALGGEYAGMFTLQAAAYQAAPIAAEEVGT